MSYYLPNETTQTIEKHIKVCKNLGLILDKYIPISVFEKPGKNDKNKGKTPWLLEILEPTKAEDTDRKQIKHIDLELAQSAYHRWRTMVTILGAQPFELTLDWRMVVGLGGETVLETDLTLHHLYGIPYIPGGALKGLVRAYVTGEKKDFLSKNIEDDNKEVKRIFGSQEQAGTVIFFDSMPLNGQAAFALDIMNPHYPKYYGEKALPTNDQDPNPVTYLTVASTKFTFALAPRSPKAQEDVNKAREWLQEALQEYGVGGKTSAGYGYFKKETPSTELPQPEKAQEPVDQTQEPSRATEHIRPRIPQFREGQDITGSVLTPTDDLRRIAPPDARAFLRYQSFATKDVLIVVNAEEAENWKSGETRICVFVREEERSECTVLVCQPRVKKDKKR